MATNLSMVAIAREAERLVYAHSDRRHSVRAKRALHALQHLYANRSYVPSVTRA